MEDKAPSPITGKRFPTERQVKAFKKVVEEGKQPTVAMREAGFSPSVARTPQNLTESEGWKYLMEKYIPDNLLAEKHRQLLEATDKDGNTEYGAVKAGVELGYKLKGKFAPEKSISVNVEMEINNEEDLLLAQQLLEQRKSKVNNE